VPTVAPTTQAIVRGAMYQTVNQATSVHVVGTYTWPGIRLRFNAGLLTSGDVAGLIVENGDPTPVVDVAGTMYTKATQASLAYIHDSAQYAAICGKYMIIPHGPAHKMLRSMGPSWMFSELLYLSQLVKHVSATTYHGQPALSAAAVIRGKHADFILSATPQRYPLRVRYQGSFVLTFSKWNAVPAPVAPPKSQIVPLVS
jgi:hypothetical protein